MKVKKQLPNGQSVIEVTVALVIVGLIAISLIKVGSLSVKNARYSSEETEALAFAEKKIVELKYEAANNSEFWTNPLITDYGIENGYCYLISVVDKKADVTLMPTNTTPRYSDAKLAEGTVEVFWALKEGANASCSTAQEGKSNYDHNLNLKTYLTQ